jgi:transcription elongation factor Elf1
MDDEISIRQALQAKIPEMKCACCNSLQFVIIGNDGNPSTVTLACVNCGNTKSFVINILKKGIPQ